MINKIHLKNWRSHSESTLEFGRGTNALLGPMGSGKSSVMNAICFGLFGTFPDLQTRKIKIDDIIMNKPSVKDESQVTVNFTVSDKKYSVMRVIERDKGTTYSEIREGDKLLDAPNSQRVTEIIEKILRIDYEVFSRAIYSEQNGLDYFLRLPRGERMKRIDNLLMIDRFEKARSGTVTLRNRIIETKNAKESVFNLDSVKDIRKSLEDTEYSLEKLDETKDNLSKELDTKNTRREKLKEKIKKLEESEEKLESLKKRKNSIEGSLKEIKSSIAKYSELVKEKKLDTSKQELREIKELLEKYNSRLREKRGIYDKLTREISEKETKVNFIKEKVEELEDKIGKRKQIKDKIKKIKKDFGDDPAQLLLEEKKDLEKLQKEITESQTRIDQTKESMVKISKTKDRCPTCESKIDKKKKGNLIKTFEDRINSLNQKLTETKDRVKKKSSRLNELEKTSRELDLYSEKIKDLEDFEKALEKKKKEKITYLEIISRKKEKFDKIKTEISGIDTNLKKIEQKKQKLVNLIEKMTDLHKKKIRLRDFNQELEKLKNKILEESQETEEQNIGEIRDEFTNLVSRTSELTTRIQGLSDVINEKIQRKEEYEKKIKQIEKQKTEIEKLRNLIKGLKIFETSLEKTQSQLRENFVDTVNYTMSQIWSDIYPYEDFIGTRLSIEDRDYVLQLQRESGKWIDVEGIVSGGERSMASLVLRIAFSSVLAPQLKWLVLDEPTHNLDSRAIDDLSETLRSRIDNFADQLFLITHEKRLENAVTGNLYMLSRHRKTGDVSKVKMVN